MLTFRDLKASEIDCRIATVKPNGISLLLYKDARVDQNILDETVGPFNWQRSHEVLDGNLYSINLRCRKRYLGIQTGCRKRVLHGERERSGI